MRSYQVIEWGEPLQPRDYDTPEPKGTEVLVRIEACGVCHSDLHIWGGGFDLGDGKLARLEDRGVKPPFTMGHEPIGEVAALGPDADGVAVGDKRIVFPWIGCGACEPCAAGLENLCAAPRFIGARVDGGYADHVIVPHAKYLVPYEGVARNLAATYACSGVTAWAALKKLAHLGERDHLLVIGAGGVGHNGIHLAPSVTPAKLIVADVDPTKRAAARQSGAAQTVDNAEKGALKKVIEMSGGGVGGVIDFVGRPETFDFGVNSMRRGGTHVVVGLFGGAASVPIPMFPFMSRTVCGSYVGTLAEMHEMMAAIAKDAVPPIPIEARPMSQINGALEDLAAGKVLGRIVVET